MVSKLFSLHEKISQSRMSKKWDKVMFYAKKCLAIEPNDVYAIQSIGEVLEKQGQIVEALLYYEKALEADGRENREIGHTLFLKRLDIINHRFEKYEDCLRVSEYYAKRHPDSWDAWNRLWRACQKTGNLDLGNHAKKQADDIKAKIEAEKRAKEIEYQKWRGLYEQKLAEMGYQQESITKYLNAEPHPSFEASDEEWGQWLQRTTDGEKIDAQIQAGLYASMELRMQERENLLDSPKKMNGTERERIIQENLENFIEGHHDVLIFTDRERPDNYVQFAGFVCEVSSRNHPASQLPSLSKAQIKNLMVLGFNQRDSVNTSQNLSLIHRGLNIDQLTIIVKNAFRILGSPDDFELLIET